MSIAFSNSMRSLHSDRYRPSLIGLGIAIFLLLMWFSWFFFAQLTTYGNGQIVQTRGDGQILADFPAEIYEQIQRGDLAYIRPSGALAQEIVAIPATVLTVQPLAQSNLVRVELFAKSDDPSTVLALDEGFGGEVAVELEHISPATFALRASGQFLETPSISLSPQQ